MTPTTYGNIHVSANISVFLIIEVGVGYFLWQIISPWHTWLLAFLVVSVIIAHLGHRLFPKLSGPIVDHFIKDKVDATK